MPTLRQKRQSTSSWSKPEREPFGDVVFNLNGSHSSHCKLKISGKNPGRLFYRKQMCAVLLALQCPGDDCSGSRSEGRISSKPASAPSQIKSRTTSHLTWTQCKIVNPNPHQALEARISSSLPAELKPPELLVWGRSVF